MCKFNIIVAVDKHLGIGQKNSIPWKIKQDMAFFRDTTSRTKDPFKQNLVIMGRKTWDSLPDSFKPLPNRINLVISSKQTTFGRNVLHQPSFSNCMKNLKSLIKRHNIETVFIIGGGQIYKEAISHEYCNLIYMTQLEETYSCDIFFPPIPHSFEVVSSSEKMNENGTEFKFKALVKSDIT